MPQVFVSHSTEDAAIARQVADALRAAGVGVWIAPDSIRPGEAYNEAIVAGLKASDTLAVLVSKASNASKHVAREVGLADSQGKRIIPIRIEAVEPSDGLTYYLSMPQWVEWHARGPAALAPLIGMLGGKTPATEFLEVDRGDNIKAALGLAGAMGSLTGAMGASFAAVIRVHRPSRGAYAARMIAILVDGQKVGEIANGATADFTVQAGRREIMARVDYVKSKPFPVDTSAGRARVLELDVPEMANVGGQVAGLLGQSSFFNWKLIE